MNYETRVEQTKSKLKNVQKSIKKGIQMMFKVNTAKDERVCNDCKEYEGHIDSAENAKIGINHPPFHNDCRCFATYKIAGIKNKEDIN